MTVDRIESTIIRLIEDGYDVTLDGGDALVPSLDLDSLDMAEVVLAFEMEWPELEDKLDFDNPVLRKGTVRELAVCINQIIGNPPQ